MISYRSLLILPFLLSSLNIFAELIPAGRLTNWSPGTSVGVPGGIPTDRTRILNVVTQFHADNTGATSASPAIGAAIAAAVNGDIVYFPAGRYLSTGIVIPAYKAITLRGAGMDATTIDNRNNNAIYVGTGSDYSWSEPQSGNIVTSGTRTAGTQTLTIPNTSAFSVGQMILIGVKNQQNDEAIKGGAVPVFQVRPLDPYVRKQQTRVIAKTATTLTFSPALYFDCSNLDMKITVFRQMGLWVGIEDMTVDCTNSSAQWAIWFEQCYASWIKNVRVKNAYNYAFFFSNALNCEIRGSFADRRKPGGSNGAGLLINTCSACLIEDNIAYKFNPGIEVNAGSAGNVVAYNLFEDARPTAGINTNHNPHNSFNLYEGNIATNIQCDGYYGSGSEDTVYRNWLTGTIYDGSAYLSIVSLNRFTRRYSLVGNILGTPSWPYGENPYSMGNPNMGNSSYTGSAQPSTGNFWRDWKATATLTTRTSDISGKITLNSGVMIASYNAPSIGWASGLTFLSNMSVSGNQVTFTSNGTLPPQGTIVNLYTGENGFQDLDLDVAATTLLKGNLHLWGVGAPKIPPSQSLGQEILPVSLFRSGKPAFFGSLEWPAFDPLQGKVGYDRLPAGYRFVHGGTTPGFGDSDGPVAASVPQAPSDLRVN